MQYLNLALRAVRPGRDDSTRDFGGNRPVKRDSRGQTRKPDPFSIPFGPNLAAVQQDPEISPEVAPEHGNARTKMQNIQPSPALTQSALWREGLDNSAEDCREAAHREVTTNDLLDCLAHPDIIARVTELLLERHAGKSRSAPFC